MCQKSSYERRCEDCHMRVIISVVTHQVCGGKPREKLTKAQEEKRKNHKIPYRKDDFICKLRIRPHKKYWSYIGAHTCMRCSLQKLKKEVEEELKALVDGNGMESEIYLKKGSIRDGIEYLFKESLEADQQPNNPTASTDPPTTSAGEPSSRASARKGKEKAVATTEVEDVPSEATRSSPFPGPDLMRIQDIVSDVEMEDREGSEVEATQTDVQPPRATPATSSAEARFWTWSNRV
ncbi:hypothetical protein LZL87_008341 [Fusarium oxysporum]|nr:hypothetical protein LZL87_008341 [Fusarium oxysporum]